MDDRIRHALATLCMAHGISTLRIFGSVARGDEQADSDVDVLIEFLSGIDPDLFELGGIQQDLTAILGRTVDLKTPEMFSPANFQRVVTKSVLGYAA